MNDILKSLKPAGSYTKTDIQSYSELRPGNIQAALLYKMPGELYLVFNLIENKDSCIGAELEKRYSTIEGKFVTSSLDANFNNAIGEITAASMDATLFGFGVIELFLNDSGGFDFRRIEKEYFIFQNNVLFLKSNNVLFEPTAPKFIIFRRKPLLLKTLWLTYAKHFVLSHYLKFTEFLGVPPIISNASSSDEATITSIADALRNIKSGGFAVFGPNDIVKVLEGRGSQADFLAFVRYADNEIAKIINGSVLSSGTSSSGGSLAQAKVHEENRYDIVAKDARYAEKCINQAFATIGMQANANVLVEKDVDLLQRAQTLEILNRLGYSLSPDQIATEFDLPIAANDTPKAIAQNSKQTAPLNLDRFDAGINSKNFKASLNSIELEINASLNAILAKSSSYEEAFAALLNAYPDTKMDTLESVMFRAVANSGLLGSVD